MTRLTDRSALITGGAQGLGRAIARRLASEGASVTIVDLNAAEAEKTVLEIGGDGGRASFVRTNVADDEAVAASVAAAVEFGGGLDVVVNAAQFFAMPKALELVSAKDWALSESTGPRATFRFMQEAFPHLRASGHGSIVNFTSGSAIGGIAYTAPYSAAKGAILALTRVAATEWATYGIRVNALCPFALTPVQAAMIGTDWDNYSRTAEQSPMGRGADPDTEIAPIAAFLSSDDSAFVTGTVLYADGGLTELSSVDYSGSPGIHDAPA
jgi:NAD(P)-dependent dehydrogenase (short-subunit alcohol dehydrogenase family)